MSRWQRGREKPSRRDGEMRRRGRRRREAYMGD
jgi:hypothetical protein